MTTANSQEKNFLASLFDFNFTSFVTLRFLKVIYAIFVVLVLISGVFILIAGLSTGTSIGIFAAIIFAPLVTLVYLVFARIAFEVIAMFFRIGDNTFLAVQLLGGKPAQWAPTAQPGYAPPDYGAQPGPGAQPGTGGQWGYGPGATTAEPAQRPTTSAPYGPPSYQQPQNPVPAHDVHQQPTQVHKVPPLGPQSQGMPSAPGSGQSAPPPENPQPGQERWGQSPNQP